MSAAPPVPAGQDARAPSATSRPPPRATNAPSRSAVSCGTGTSLRMTTDARCRSSVVSASIDLAAISNGGASPSASARDRYRLASRGAPGRSAMTMRSGALGETRKWKALSSASASAPIFTVPRVSRAAGVNAAKVTDAELCWSTLMRSVCTCAAVDLERDLEVRDGHGTVIGHAARDGHPLLIGEGRALNRDGRHADVRRGVVDDRDGPQHHAVRKPHALGALPAGTLEVRDQDHFAARQRRLARDAAGELQRGTVPRGPRTGLAGRQRRVQPSPIRRRAQGDLRAGREEHDRRAVRRPDGR